MVYTDGIHLMSDNQEELHKFAKEIGLKRDWFQANPKHPHYDLLSKVMVWRALNSGAIKTTTREMLEKCKKSNLTG